ncbi:MAG: transcriptional regulator [Methanomassiliicoccaceae archaeon]|nr:transcriptional regulator [Methanomassiliicoccaceae archaeon]
MAVKDDILSVMNKSGKPMSPGEIEKAVGAGKADFEKAFKELKAEGAVVSPIRCKWEPAKG